jgi:hypothetical protein
MEEAGQHFKGCGLAGAVWPQKTYNLPVSNVKRDAGHRGDFLRAAVYEALERGASSAFAFTNQVGFAQITEVNDR